MIEDLKNIDELFRNTISRHEEDPSQNVWESLQARLDKEDATKYKRKFNSARRIVISLTVLLLLFILFETGLKKLGYEKPTGLNGVKNEEEIKPGDDKTTGSAMIGKIHGQIPSPRKQLQQVLGSQKFSNGPLGFIGYGPDKKAEKIHHLMTDKDEIGQLSIITVSREKTKKELATVSQDEFSYPKLNPVVFLQSGDFFIASSNKTIVPSKKDFSSGSGSSAAQTVLNKKKLNEYFKPYWTITALASPELTNYNLQNDVTNNNGTQSDEKSQIEQREKHQHSFAIGLLASYQFKKHWVLQSGLFYTNTAITIDPETIYAAKDGNGEIAYKYNSSSGYAFVKPKQPFGLVPALGDSLMTSSAQHNLKYISIPLTLKYKIDVKKFSISPGLGVSFNFLTAAKIKTEVGDSLNAESIELSRLEGTKVCDISLLANAGLQYNSNGKWSIAVMPGFRYAITPITKNNVVKTYPYSFGVAVGITKKL